jgi:ribosome maturation factor RimP
MKEMGSDRKVTLCCCKNKFVFAGKNGCRIIKNGCFPRENGKRKSEMKKSVKETVREAILPTVTELGYRIWDVTYSKVGADYHLEITIDNDEGININDCEKVHRAIDPIIDECDPIEGFYYLDVSSPGAERDLRTDEHILYCIGWRVEAKLFSQKDGRKSFVGTLVSYEDSTVSIKEGDEVVALGRDEISKLTTLYTEA